MKMVSEVGSDPVSERASTTAPGLFDSPDAAGEAPAPRTSTLVCDTILTWDAFDTWLATLQAAELTAVDTETTSLDAMRAEIVGISFSTQVGQAAYVPLAHRYPGAPEQLNREDVLAKLKPWLEDPAAKKLGQHIKYDRHVLANHGIEVQGYAHDTMLQSYVLEAHLPHGLESLAQRHLGRSIISTDKISEPEFT